MNVVIEKFTKWLKATPVVNINKQYVVKFIKSIICRFGVLNRIITDNGSQFTSRVFQKYCEDLGSKYGMHLLRIQRLMDKLKGPMLKHSRVSRCAPTTA
jgi:hypothetical protein